MLIAEIFVADTKIIFGDSFGDPINCKKQFKIVGKLNNSCKRNYFDKMDFRINSNLFWRTYKPCFYNKHSKCDSKIMLKENYKIFLNKLNVTGPPQLMLHNKFTFFK